MTWPHDQSFWFLLFGSTNWLIKWISFLDFSEEAQLIVFNLTKKSIFKTPFNFNFREISKANMMILKWEVIKRGPFSTAANSISACMKVASGSIRNIILKKDINKQTKIYSGQHSNRKVKLFRFLFSWVNSFHCSRARWNDSNKCRAETFHPVACFRFSIAFNLFDLLCKRSWASVQAWPGTYLKRRKRSLDCLVSEVPATCARLFTAQKASQKPFSDKRHF